MGGALGATNGARASKRSPEMNFCSSKNHPEAVAICSGLSPTRPRGHGGRQCEQAEAALAAEASFYPRLDASGKAASLSAVNYGPALTAMNIILLVPRGAIRPILNRP